ncbi:putative ribonuclease H-like domain, reverse transcriptase zinc-binding domain-containing protein [Rosa chinensis]|uniref:Putative ribonuclease H-like domain, reverse transcriptase zinc-binding domain-containing protein n=1 Tax=Rosa chinensis TaxID=74649 RepID=A0A2P6PUV1_ROSCH|nr:putative ribonuclease H-like domain, reverse transcriptase zinc-binding domain-containing protein [Rosa chinensis]
MEGTKDFMVADLIDEGGREWVMELLEELFTSHEVDTIAAIPLSLRNSDDRLVWHYDRKGIYSVKSGYYIFHKAQTVRDCASGSMGEGGAWRRYWHMLWSASVPPKVKLFMWKLIKGILPTKCNLVQKKVSLPDEKCTFCMAACESGTHLFKDCPTLLCFWLYGPLHLNPVEHPAKTLSSWTLDMLDILSVDQCDFFFMGLWAVWFERNKMVWKNDAFQPLMLIEWAVRHLVEFQKYHPKAVRKKKQAPMKWQCSPRGRLKINVDGAFRADVGCGGIGVVVRDDVGMGIAALARPFLHAHSVLNMEAEACRAGLLLGIHQGWSDIEIESDSAILVAALNSGEKNFSQDVIYEDYCNSTYVARDSGYMSPRCKF